MSSETDLTSVKELASKLNETDALVKKLIRDFNIPCKRIKKRIHLSEEAVKIIKEVLLLRSQGKKHKDIKELFDQDPEKRKFLESTTSTDIDEDSESTDDEPAAPKEAAVAPAAIDPPPPSSAAPPKPVFDISEYVNEKFHEKDIDDSDIDSALELSEEEDLSEGEEYLFDENDSQSEEEAKALSPRKIRRRAFNFRYIQRQIANDIKRVNYIKHKLNRGRLSNLERIHLEESLDKRSKLLDGWLHLMRWVKS